MLTIQVNNKTYELDKSFKFSGGELQIRLPEMLIQKGDTVYVNTILNSSDAIFEALLVDNALSKIIPDSVSVILTVNYMPYARQDRVCYRGEAFSAEVIHSVLSKTSYDYIRFADLHSQQNMDNKFYGRSQLSIFKMNSHILDVVDVIISPDAGATHKADAIANHFSLPISQSKKVRDCDTGELKDITIDDSVDLSDKNLLIVDDVCDGGGTFIWTASELLKHNPKSIALYVTHGIFSKGVQILLDSGIDHIYTTDSFYDKNGSHDNVTVIEL